MEKRNRPSIRLINVNCLIFFSLSFILLFRLPCVSAEEKNIFQIDTSRFNLNISDGYYFLTDSFLGDRIAIDSTLLLRSDSTSAEEEMYVSSFNYAAKVTAFDIGNGLLGLQVVSFDFMKSGSAQAAAGRDAFLIYDPEKHLLLEKVLQFGVTKERLRYLGCFRARTGHFILADADSDGSADIGLIKEEIGCTENYENYFQQHATQWYVFKNNSWQLSSDNFNPKKYLDLPLIDVKLSPVDVVGFNLWHTFDPRLWPRKTGVSFNPEYRRRLIEK